MEQTEQAGQTEQTEQTEQETKSQAPQLTPEEKALISGRPNIQVIPMALIKPYWRNPRNNAAAVDGVIESVRRYGFCQPLVVDRENVIICGHTRYKALSLMGVEEVSCVVSDMPSDKAKQYRVVDNKTSELATWKNDDLLAELREFEGLENFQVFFKDQDLSGLMNESIGQLNKEIETKDVEDKAGEEKFKDRSDQLEVTCPGCADSFFVNRKDVLNRP